MADPHTIHQRRHRSERALPCQLGTLRAADADLHPDGVSKLTAVRYGVKRGTASRQPVRETRGVWPRVRPGYFQNASRPAARNARSYSRSKAAFASGLLF